MATYVYDDFRVTFAPRADGSFDVRATDHAGAQASGVFTTPLGDDELQRAILRVARSNSRKAGRDDAPVVSRDVGSDEPPALDAEQIGTLLGSALLSGGIGDSYERARMAAEANGRGLRLSLSLANAPALLSVPWEFLYRRPRFLASQRHTPLVRWLDSGMLAPPPAIEASVRILGVVASPHDLAPLDVDAERRRVAQAVAKVRDLGRVELDWLEPATPRRLREALRDDSYHILHYVGHSDFTAAGDGVLYLEDAQGAAAEVDSTALANLLSDQGRLRLVVLNSCEGARTTLNDPYAGVATTLIQLGVPAVVGMQFPISDDVAILFAEELYTNLIGRQDPIDAAVAEARKAIYIELDKVEWATPVLFVRDPEVELFRFEVPAAPLPPPPPPRTPADTGKGDGNDDGHGGGDGDHDGADAATTTTPLQPEPEPERQAASSGAGRRSRVVPALAAAIVLAIAATVTGILLANRDGESEVQPTSPASGSQGQQSSLGPRPHTGLLAVQVARPSGEIHLFTIDPNSGSVDAASNDADARDEEPDWDVATNRLAFVRKDSSVAACIGICYVVPGDGQGDPGRRVAQLVPASSTARQHAPAWARDEALYYALTSDCEVSGGCPGEVHRVTFDVSDDDRGFADVLTQAQDDIVLTGVNGISDIDVDPQDERRLLVVDERGVAIARDGEVETRRAGSDGAVAATFAPDGSHVVGRSLDHDLVIWDRSGAVVSEATIGEMLLAHEASGVDLGSLDPSDAVALSLSPDVADAFVLVLVGDSRGRNPPQIAVLGPGDEGGLVVADVRAFPLDVLDEGSIEAIAR
ncbi:MAG: CHAT domain-containing protein [Ilumatobacteraceae bacterium]